MSPRMPPALDFVEQAYVRAVATSRVGFVVIAENVEIFPALRSALLVSVFLLTRTRRSSLPSSATRGYPRRTGARCSTCNATPCSPPAWPRGTSTATPHLDRRTSGQASRAVSNRCAKERVEARSAQAQPPPPSQHRP